MELQNRQVFRCFLLQSDNFKETIIYSQAMKNYTKLLYLISIWKDNYNIITV